MNLNKETIVRLIISSLLILGGLAILFIPGPDNKAKAADPRCVDFNGQQVCRLEKEFNEVCYVSIDFDGDGRKNNAISCFVNIR